MKQRLRRVLDEKSRENPGDTFFAEQLALFDAAHIGTLHGFCFKLVREHFYELGLDPQPAVLDEGEARLLADETLEETVAGAIRRRGRICRVGPKADSNSTAARAMKKSARWFCACTITRRRGPMPKAGSRDKLKNFPPPNPPTGNSGCSPPSPTGAMSGCRFWKIWNAGLGAKAPKRRPEVARHERAEIVTFPAIAWKILPRTRGGSFGANHFRRRQLAGKTQNHLRKPLEDLFDEANFSPRSRASKMAATRWPRIGTGFAAR